LARPETPSERESVPQEIRKKGIAEPGGSWGQMLTDADYQGCYSASKEGEKEITLQVRRLWDLEKK